jgi:membrane associated rhomboid family serine protease
LKVIMPNLWAARLSGMIVGLVLGWLLRGALL